MASFEPFNGQQETFQIWSAGKFLRAIKLTDPDLQDDFAQARQQVMLLNHRMSEERKEEEDEDARTTGQGPHSHPEL